MLDSENKLFNRKPLSVHISTLANFTIWNFYSEYFPQV